MAQTKFFTRKSDSLEEYKTNFQKAISKIEIARLFDKQVIDFLKNWIENQKSYIPREDVDNLEKNINLVFKSKDFYEYLLPRLKNIKNNSNILEYSFNLISEFDESAKKFEDYKKKKDFRQNLEKQKQESKKKELEEAQKILDSL